MRKLKMVSKRTKFNFMEFPKKVVSSKKEKILFICGSLNQTTIMHKISKHLQSEYDCYFTPYYADGLINLLAKLNLLEPTVLGRRHQNDTMNYLKENHLSIDLRGESNHYDLVVTGSDLIIQKNIRNHRIVLVQEGITEPETIMYYLAKYLKFPRALANTAATGLSDQYDIFCVASRGYRDHFIKKGVKPNKIVVTGIPNFDDVKQLLNQDFPLQGYVLVATSPLRETLRHDNRKHFLKECYRIANGRPMIFKLHPTEKAKRARKEIEKYCPGAVVYTHGSVERMIANAEVVITQQSSCTFTALALEKEIYTYLDMEELKRLMPIQNNGYSAERIARICKTILHTPPTIHKPIRREIRSRSNWETKN